jgi:hypothetical protein
VIQSWPPLSLYSHPLVPNPGSRIIYKKINRAKNGRTGQTVSLCIFDAPQCTLVQRWTALPGIVQLIVNNVDWQCSFAISVRHSSPPPRSVTGPGMDQFRFRVDRKLPGSPAGLPTSRQWPWTAPGETRGWPVLKAPCRPCCRLAAGQKRTCRLGQPARSRPAGSSCWLS